MTDEFQKVIELPPPRKRGDISLEETIARRRSVRRYFDEPLTREEISQIIWAGQGITDERRRLRASPSAGALFPVEIYAVLSEGIYHYSPQDHKLIGIREGDHRSELAKASLGQRFIEQVALNIAMGIVYERLAWKYGERGRRYIYMECGHIAQNIHLQAIALGLDSVPVGAFIDREVASVLSLPPGCEPAYIISVGRAR